LPDVGREYRENAVFSVLPKVAPKHMNPTQKAAASHKRRCPLEFMTLYSNNGASAEFGRVKDWIVMHVHAAGQAGMQRMVITETRGLLGGHCVVCGREMACRRHSGAAQ
jgi:hypothetical protein